MKFKKIPLFGQDSSPQHTSNILALIGTLAFWLFFLICMIFIKQKPQKPKFKEIQIVLPQDFSTQKNTAKKEEKSESGNTEEEIQEVVKALENGELTPEDIEEMLNDGDITRDEYDEIIIRR